MNYKEYFTALKNKTIILLAGYSSFLIASMIRNYINGNNFNYKLIPPYIFYNTTTCGILFGLLISPFIYKKRNGLQNKYSEKTFNVKD